MMEMGISRTHIGFLVGVLLVILMCIVSIAPISLSADQESTMPMIINASVHPPKVTPGDTMIITTTVSDPYGITSVTADMGGIESLNLTLTDGTIYQGVWRGRWLVHDTEVRGYNATITAISSSGLKSTTKVEFSDPPPCALGYPCVNCPLGSWDTVGPYQVRDSGVGYYDWACCSGIISRIRRITHS